MRSKSEPEEVPPDQDFLFLGDITITITLRLKENHMNLRFVLSPFNLQLQKCKDRKVYKATLFRCTVLWSSIKLILTLESTIT